MTFQPNLLKSFLKLPVMTRSIYYAPMQQCRSDLHGSYNSIDCTNIIANRAHEHVPGQRTKSVPFCIRVMISILSSITGFYPFSVSDLCFCSILEKAALEQAAVISKRSSTESSPREEELESTYFLDKLTACDCDSLENSLMFNRTAALSQT